MSTQAGAAAKSAGLKAGRDFSSGLAAGSGGGAGADALVDQLTVASKKAQRIVQQERAAIGAARTAEKAAAEGVAAAEARLAEQRAKFGAESSQALKAEQQLTVAQGKHETSTVKVTAAEDQLRAATTEQKVVTAQLTEAQTALNVEQAKTPSLITKMNGAAAKGEAGLSKLKEGANGLIGSLGSLAPMLGIFAAAEFAKASVESAIEFQKSSNVLVTAAGESQKNLVMIKSGLMKISSTTGASLDQETEGMYTVEKAGIRGAAGLKVMMAASKGASDEGADLGTVTNALTSIMQSYSGSLKNPNKAMNALMVAAGHSKSTLQDFAGSLSAVLPVASKLGLPFNQITGALGTMTATGMSAQQAAQDLNHTISSLASPTKVMATEMDAFGISAQDVQNKLAKRGLGGTIEYLSNTVKSELGPATQGALKIISGMPALYQEYFSELSNGTMTMTAFENKVNSAKDLTAAQKKEIYAAIPASQGYVEAMKKMTGGIVGLNTSMMLTGSATKGMADRTTDVGKAMNSTADFQKKWNLTSQTTANRLAVAKKTIGNVGVELAGNLLPKFAMVAKGFATGVSAASNFATANKSWLGPLVLGIGAAFVAFKSITLATRAYAAVVGIIRGGIFLYIAATKGMAVAQRVATINQWSLNAAMDANPIGAVVVAITLVVAALAALVVGVIYAYNHWTWFRDGVQAAWKGIQVAAAFAWNSVLKPTFAWLSAAVVDTGNWFVWLWKSVIVPAWDGITGTARDAGKLYDTVLTGITTGVQFAGKILTAVWTGITVGFAAVGQAVVSVGDWFSWLGGIVASAAKTAAAPFVWLYNTVLLPIFKGAAVVVEWFAQAFYAVGRLIDTIVIDVIGAAFLWLYAQVVKPVVAAVGAAWTWLYTSVILPIGNVITSVITEVGGWFTWLYANALKPAWNAILSVTMTTWAAVTGAVTAAWNGIVTATTVAYTWISGILHSIVSFLANVLAVAFSWLYNSVVKPVWAAIGAAISFTHSAILVPVFNAIVSAAHSIGGAFSWLYNNAIRPAWDSIGSSVSTTWNKGIKPVFSRLKTWVTKDIPDAFGSAVSAVGKAWDGLKNIVKAPIKFIVNTVLDGGLIDPFNSIAKKVEGKGASLIPRINLPKGFAGGGVLPGYQSAKRDELMVPMRKGEGVLVPEVVRALGPSFVHTLNAAGNSGGVGAVRNLAGGGFATGGILGDITSFVSNPLGSLSKLVSSAEASIPGAGVVVDLAKGVVTKLVSSAASALGNMYAATGTSATSGNAGGSVANPTGSNVTRWKPDVIKALAANGLSTSTTLVQKVLRQIQTESGGNPAAVQHGYTDVNTLSGDLAKGLMQTISTTFEAYEFPGHGNIFNGYDNLLAALNYAKHTYGPNLNGLGEGHGYAYGGVIPSLYDQGGILPQGVSLVANKTKKPEYALPESRLVDVVRQAGNGQSGATYAPVFNNPDRGAVREFESWVHRREVLAGGR
jgi:TP901 family phage tail tape measure protein